MIVIRIRASSNCKERFERCKANATMRADRYGSPLILLIEAAHFFLYTPSAHLASALVAPQIVATNVLREHRRA
jgi:hypothetical protein